MGPEGGQVPVQKVFKKGSFLLCEKKEFQRDQILGFGGISLWSNGYLKTTINMEKGSSVSWNWFKKWGLWAALLGGREALQGQTIPPLVPLYTGTIPLSKPAENLETGRKNEWGVWFTTAISVPSLKIFPAPRPDGPSVVICPGGGYFGTADDHEGDQVARALNQLGVGAVVLKYRIPDERYCTEPRLAPWCDLQHALRWVRTNGPAAGLGTAKVGVLGFSAGGHLAATGATGLPAGAAVDLGERPDFAVLIYPVVTLVEAVAHRGSAERLLGAGASTLELAQFSAERLVSAATPPTFLVHASDDEPVPVENSLLFYQALRKAGVRAEMHLYDQGGHGFGLYNSGTSYRWIDRLASWLAGLEGK